MGTGDLPRRAAKTAALAGGSAATAGVAALGILVAQGYQARRTVGPRTTVPAYADGRYGSRHGVSLRLAILGDSLATGLGAEFGFQTPGALLADQLARASGRPVVLSTIAEVGARTEHLAGQIERAMIIRPHVAVISIGGNDVTHLIPQSTSIKELTAAVARLREGGTEVVVGTCPDLGTIRPIRPPLRNVARRLSRRLAAAQAVAVAGAGGRPVPLGALLGPEFAARPGDLFSADQFHPNADGYAAMAEILSPVVQEAAGLGARRLPAVLDPAARIERDALILTADSTAADQGVPYGQEI